MTQLTRRSVLAAGAATSAAALAAPALAQITATGPVPSLKGRSILITGSSSGFGRLGALLFARAGAKVFATMRGLPRVEASDLAAIASSEKLDLTVLPLDVTSDQQVADTIGEAERLAGGALDVLVNNAGINIHGPVEVQDIEAMHLSFDTNVYGLQRTTRAALPAMRARKAGLIVNVSSQVGRFVTPMGGIYSATKFAVESMSEGLAYELVAHGIEVCIIQPGGFPTAIGANRARLTSALAARTPERHADGYPEAVAGMRARPAPSAGQSQAAAAAMGSARPDPEDVPRAIAEVIAMTPGTRPLRVPVHPGTKPQLEINRVSRETQLAVLGRGPWAEAAKAVLD